MKKVLKYLAIAFAVALAGTAIIFWVVIGNARTSLAEQRAEIAARGEPLTIEDLVRGEAPRGVETLEWLRTLQTSGRLGEHWSDEILYETFMLDKAISDEREARGEPETIAAIEELREFLVADEGSELTRLLQAFLADEQQIGNPALFDAAKRRGLWLWAGDSKEVRQLAQEVAGLVPFNFAARAAEGNGRPPMQWPPLPLITQIRLVRRLARSSLRPAIDGEGSEAVRRLDLALQAAGLARDPENLSWSMSRRIHHLYCLKSLSHALPLLAPEVDLTSIEERLDALDIRTEFLDAWRGERVLTLGSLEFVGGPSASFYLRWTMDISIRSGLEAMTDCIAELEATWEEAGERPVVTAPSGGSQILGLNVSGMVLPQLERSRKTAKTHESLVLQARLALAIRREGLEAMRAELETVVDPLSGGYFQVESGGEGFVALRSVGEDPWTWWIRVK